MEDRILVTQSDRPTVLLIDDDPGSVLVINKALGAHYRVHFVTSGARALAWLAERRPDLILLDMVMPEMDGIAVLKRLRDNEATRRIPVLFVTISNDASTETLALSSGADDFIHKPINPDVLRARVANHLEKNQLRRSLENHRDRLEQDKAYYRQIFEVNSAIKLIIAPDSGRILEANAAASRFYGYTPEQLRDKRMQDLAADPREPIEDKVLRATRERASHSASVHRLASGELRHIEVYAGPVEREGQAVIYAIIHDVTARHLAEEAVRQSALEQLYIQQQLRDARSALLAMIDTLPIVIGRWDRDQCCLIANRALAAWFGLPLGTMPGRPYREVIGETLHQEHQPIIQRVLAGETVVCEQIFPPQSDAEPRHGLMRYLPDKAGDKVQGFYLQVEDISLVVRAREAAQQANAAKSAFLATMSHEIRTPLNAIIGTAYLMGQSTLEPAQQQDLQSIDAASRNLLALINDVLDFSKIEAGELTLESRAFAPHELLEELRVLLAPIASGKGIALEVTAPPAACPPMLVGDPDRLRQILVNLINNALKFTERGRVGCAMELADQSDGVARLRLRVTDTGIGIAADMLPRLFDDFMQVDSSADRTFGGTGLGLPIVKRLAQLMGGHVTVESQPGFGSTFVVELPFRISNQAPRAAAPRPDGQAEPAQPLHGARVLVVDDHAINLRVAGRLLERAGAQAVTCTSGEEALTALHEAAAPFDLVLMDLQMPGMDGCETTERIRRDATIAPLPILALTAGATTTERQRAMDAGLDGFLAKPLDPARFPTVLRQYLDEPASQS